MQIYDLNSYWSVNGPDMSSQYDNLDIGDSKEITDVEQFGNVLKDYLSKDYKAELEQKAIEVPQTDEKEMNSNYLSDLSESLLNSGSGRKVITSMIENQIMGIVTGNTDEELNNTLQSLLLGKEVTNTMSDLEKTLMSLQSNETQTDK